MLLNESFTSCVSYICIYIQIVLFTESDQIVFVETLMSERVALQIDAVSLGAQLESLAGSPTCNPASCRCIFRRHHYHSVGGNSPRRKQIPASHKIEPHVVYSIHVVRSDRIKMKGKVVHRVYTIDKRFIPHAHQSLLFCVAPGRYAAWSSSGSHHCIRSTVCSV